jgi:hypothetical protein
LSAFHSGKGLKRLIVDKLDHIFTWWIHGAQYGFMRDSLMEDAILGFRRLVESFKSWSKYFLGVFIDMTGMPKVDIWGARIRFVESITYIGVVWD